jgi:hypothetical protein
MREWNAKSYTHSPTNKCTLFIKHACCDSDRSIATWVVQWPSRLITLPFGVICFESIEYYTIDEYSCLLMVYTCTHVAHTVSGYLKLLSKWNAWSKICSTAECDMCFSPRSVCCTVKVDEIPLLTNTVCLL